MNKKLIIAVSIICAVAIGLSVAAIAIVCTSLGGKTEAPKQDVQYVLYLGTNDKDTNTPVFTPEEAQAKLKEILLDKFGGYTIQEAHGGWKDGDTVYNEYTLVIYLSDTTADKVHQASDDLIAAFNQSSVLIQMNRTETEFYAGK